MSCAAGSAGVPARDPRRAGHAGRRRAHALDARMAGGNHPARAGRRRTPRRRSGRAGRPRAGLRQAARRGAQQHVTGLVALGVVVGLEMVEVEHGHGEAALAAARRARSRSARVPGRGGWRRRSADRSRPGGQALRRGPPLIASAAWARAARGWPGSFRRCSRPHAASGRAAPRRSAARAARARRARSRCRRHLGRAASTGLDDLGRDLRGRPREAFLLGRRGEPQAAGDRGSHSSATSARSIQEAARHTAARGSDTRVKSRAAP